MPVCAMRTCGERGQFACKKSEGEIISFHQFPSNRRIRSKWIKATGQRKTISSWHPTKESTICSKHFKREDFLTCTDLKASAVPIEEALLQDHVEQLQIQSTSSGYEGDEFEQIMDTQNLDELSQEFLDGIMEDSVTLSDSVDDTIESLQDKQTKKRKNDTNKENYVEDEEIAIFEQTTTSTNDQPESNQAISIQDSELELSDTSSELEFTELNSSETKSSRVSTDAVASPQSIDQEPAYGLKISEAYSTRKRIILRMKDQTETNIKMYKIDPLTNTVRPVESITKDKAARQNINPSGKPIYIIKKSRESMDAIANKTTKNIAPETGMNNKRVMTLLYKEEQKKVYSTPVPKLAQINKKLPGKQPVIIQKLRKATSLNPPMEIVSSVNVPKLISIMRKSPSSPQMPTSPDGPCSPQLILASPNVSKPDPTVSRLAPAVPIPITSVVTQADSKPTSTVSTPTPNVSTSTSTVSTLSPTVSTPSPADSMPTPTLSTSTSTVLASSLADSRATPTISTPTSTVSSSSPADSMSTVSIPITADSLRTSAEAMSPAVSMPTLTVQKSDVANIHGPVLDEYDTFAKHVATQLRHLSVESYISAQGDIQNVLSRYRLCELNNIKKKPDL